MKQEYWKVVLTNEYDEYCGSERFGSKWQAEKYAKDGLRLAKPGAYASIEHWQRQSSSVVKPTADACPATE